MRLRSVFKMRMSILNTATTEQMECIIVSFFVYHTNQELIKCFSSRFSIPYSNAAIRQSSTIESITQSILKTCEPQMIRYPSPFLAARNSPITTPIRQSPISTFKMLRIAGKLIGRMTLVRQSNRLPCRVQINFNLSGAVV